MNSGNTVTLMPSCALAKIIFQCRNTADKSSTIMLTAVQQGNDQCHYDAWISWAAASIACCKRALGANGASSAARKRRVSSFDNVTTAFAAMVEFASRRTASRTKTETGMPRKAAAWVMRCLSPRFRRKSSRAAVVFISTLYTEKFRTSRLFSLMASLSRAENLLKSWSKFQKQIKIFTQKIIFTKKSRSDPSCSYSSIVHGYFYIVKSI